MKVSSGSARNSWKRESEVNKSKKSKNKTKNKDKGRDSEGGDMWNFGSGSYGKDDMKSRIKEKPQKYKSSKEAEAYEHK